MTTPIQSFQDILDLLEQNPEYREAMRRYILDEEFRRVPADVRELRESIASLAQTVREYVAATDARLGRLEEGQAELKTDVTELKVGQIRLEEGQARLEGRIGDVAGTAYERRIVKRSRGIAGRYLGIKRAKILRSINVTEHETLDGLMETATEAGSVTDEQGYELDLADIIIAGSGAPGGADYAVIEVSETIGDNDVDRAHERAAILARAVSEPVTAAVIGKSVSDANRQRAARSSVTVIIMAE